jgi:anthranilate/para-aminobenzoate synthase component I
MDVNIIIRTALIRGQDLAFHVGGGIVADSQPQREYQETLNKAGGLIAALGLDLARLKQAKAS